MSSKAEHVGVGQESLRPTDEAIVVPLGNMAAQVDVPPAPEVVANTPTSVTNGHKRLNSHGVKTAAEVDLDQGVGDVDLVRLYLQSIGKVPQLNAEQEVDLARKMEAGLVALDRLETAEAAGQALDPMLQEDLGVLVREGEAAKDQFIRANLRLVVSIARRYMHNGMPQLDLIQEGNLGLIHAVEKFDYTKGCKFSTYADWWIRQAMTRALGRDSSMRTGTGMTAEVNAMTRERDKLEQKLGRRPTRAELAEARDVTEERIAILEENEKLAMPVSLNMPIDEAGKYELGEVIVDADDRGVAYGFTTAVIRSPLALLLDRTITVALSEVEADLLRARFGLHPYEGPIPLQELAQMHGTKPNWIGRITNRALSKLSASLPEDALRRYLR